MDAEKYNREIKLLCPTCGCDQFEFNKSVDETIELSKCMSCGRQLTKDELIRENNENISEHLKEIGNQFINDAEKELKDHLKKAFKGNKNIRIQ